MAILSINSDSLRTNAEKIIKLANRMNSIREQFARMRCLIIWDVMGVEHLERMISHLMSELNSLLKMLKEVGTVLQDIENEYTAAHNEAKKLVCELPDSVNPLPSIGGNETGISGMDTTGLDNSQGSGYDGFGDFRDAQEKGNTVGSIITQAPNPIPTNTGKITINGNQYDIYVPGYDDNDSNANFTGGGWTTIQTVPFSLTETDWSSLIAGIKMEDIEFQEYNNVKANQALAGMSLITGLMDAYRENTVTIYIQAAIQKNGSEYRAVVQFGASNFELQKRAGTTYYLSDLKTDHLKTSQIEQQQYIPIVKSQVQKLVKNVYGWEDDKTYDIRITLDPRHSSDPYLGYLSVNADGKLVFTPKLYDGDDEVLGHYTGFLKSEWEEDYSLRNIMEMSGILPDEFKTAIERMIGTSAVFTGTP